MKDCYPRKEPFVSENTAVDVDRELLAESRGTFAVDNKREYSASILPRSNQKRASLLPLLFVACICLGGILWLASRSGRDMSPGTLSRPLPVSSLPTASTHERQAPVLSTSVQPPLVVAPPGSDDHSPEPEVAAAVVAEAVVVETKASSVVRQPEPVVEEPVVTEEPVVERSVESKLVDSGREEPKAVTPKKKVAPVISQAAKSGSINWKAEPENYTIQLVAAFSEQGVKRIREQLPSTTPSTIHRTTREGRPWFILVYGSFATRQEALSAQTRLPDSTKKDVKPWVRKQGEVFTQ